MKKTDMIVDLGIALHDEFEPVDPDWSLDWWWSNLLFQVKLLRKDNAELEKRRDHLVNKVKELQVDNEALETAVNGGAKASGDATARELKWLKKIRELEDALAARDQVYAGLKSQYKNVQDVADKWEQERDEYKNMCDEYEGEIADLGNKIDQLEAELLTISEEKEEELKVVVDREHTIHNEAAAGMIAKVKELENTIDYLNSEVLKTQNRNARLEKSLDLAASNEQVRMKQLAERELVIIQKAERIKELEQKYSKLQQDLEYDKQLLAQYEAAAGDRPTSLEKDIQRALNYWGTDSDLDTADFILANFLIRQLLSLKAMKRAEREHGIPPTRAAAVSDKPITLDQLTEKVMLRNARLAHISIDDDGLGTIDVIE